MNKLKTTTVFTTTLLMGLILSRFAISKLTGWEISVYAFIEMAKPLAIKPTFFKVTTGIIISAVVVGYLVTEIFSLAKTNSAIKSEIQFNKWGTFANLFGALTIIVALIAEFSLRVQPKWLLVYIAFGIIPFSTLNIFILIKRNTETIN